MAMTGVGKKYAKEIEQKLESDEEEEKMEEEEGAMRTV